MAYIFIEPKDSLFFRKGKSMNKGEDSWADTFLLPNPSVIWGAICSMLLAHNQKSYDAADSLQLNIKGIYLQLGKLVYLPAPADLFEKDGYVQTGCYVNVKNNNSSPLISSYNFDFLLKSPEDGMEKMTSQFISLNDLKNYTKSVVEINRESIKGITNFIIEDYKISIEMNDNTGASDDGKLFRLDTASFVKGAGLLIDIEVAPDVLIPQKGLLKLGGESKTAHFQEDKLMLKSVEFNNIRKILEKKSKHFKIYFQTAWFPPEDFYSIFNEKFQIKILAPVIERIISIGGFNLGKGMPMLKSMQNAIPAGSIFLIETAEETTGNELITKLNTICYQKNGYGLIYAFPTEIN